MMKKMGMIMVMDSEFPFKIFQINVFLVAKFHQLATRNKGM
jgi:hypothetical protein